MAGRLRSTPPMRWHERSEDRHRSNPGSIGRAASLERKHLGDEMRYWLVVGGCLAVMQPALAQTAPTGSLVGEVARSGSAQCFLNHGLSTFQRNFNVAISAGTKAVIAFPSAFCKGQELGGVATLFFSGPNSGTILIQASCGPGVQLDGNPFRQLLRNFRIADARDHREIRHPGAVVRQSDARGAQSLTEAERIPVGIRSEFPALERVCSSGRSMPRAS